MNPLSYRWRRRRRRASHLLRSAKAWIIAAGALAGACMAVLLLLYLVFPDWKPCFGETTAHFEDVEVTKLGQLEEQVSYTVVTHGYEGKGLRIVWSLRTKDPSGSYVQVPGHSQLPAGTLKPESCSADQGGTDLRVPLEKQGNYQVILELFPPAEDAARIARVAQEFSL